MEIVVLVDRTTNNTAGVQNLIAQKGSSTYISYNAHKILVDVGSDDAFIHNAESLGVNIADVDICFITHGHYDFCNGLKYFLQYNKIAKIYTSTDLLGKYYSKDNEYLGVDKGLATIIQNNIDRFVYIDDEYFIDNEIYIISGNDRRSIIESRENRFYVQSNHRMEPDDFHHELYIVIGNKEKIIISGCTHKGIANVMHWVRFDNIVGFVGGIRVGGFDKDNPKDIMYVDEIINYLKKFNVKYFGKNCINQDVYDYFKDKLGDNFQQVYLGSKFTV